MKKLNKTQEIVSHDGIDSIYTIENDIYVRDVLIRADIGKEIVIGAVSDVHMLHCDRREFQNTDPSVMGTYEQRKQRADSAIENLHRCLAVIDNTDQIVLNGDTINYFHKDTLDIMEREVWDKIPNVIVTVGGHERTLRQRDNTPDAISLEERFSALGRLWRHDIYYYSRLIKEKVMVVALCDDRATVSEDTYKKLKADIELCREKGYIMLMFAHEPIATKNPAYINFTEDMALTVGPMSSMPFNLCDGIVKNGYKLLGNDSCDSVSLSAYDLIVNSADVIKGVFAGHLHHDMYVEITAKTAVGVPTVIPQYIMTTASYDGGHLMRIFVK